MSFQNGNESLLQFILYFQSMQYGIKWSELKPAKTKFPQFSFYNCAGSSRFSQTVLDYASYFFCLRSSYLMLFVNLFLLISFIQDLNQIDFVHIISSKVSIVKFQRSILTLDFMKIVKVQLPNKTSHFFESKMQWDNFLLKLLRIFNLDNGAIRVPAYIFSILWNLYSIIDYLQDRVQLFDKFFNRRTFQVYLIHRTFQILENDCEKKLNLPYKNWTTIKSNIVSFKKYIIDALEVLIASRKQLFYTDCSLHFIVQFETKISFDFQKETIGSQRIPLSLMLQISQTRLFSQQLLIEVTFPHRKNQNMHFQNKSYVQ